MTIFFAPIALLQAALDVPEVEADAETAAAADRLSGLVERLETDVERIAAYSTEQLLVALGLTAAAVAIVLLARYIVGRVITKAVSRLRVRRAGKTHGDDHYFRLESSLKKLTTLVALLIALFLILEVWGFGMLRWIANNEEVADASGAIALIIVLTGIAWVFVRSAVEFLLMPKVSDQEAFGPSARTKTIVPLMVGIGRGFVLVMAVLLILSEIGLDITPLLAGAGIIGLAIGFGSQSLVKDFLTGLTIILEDSVAVGEVARVAGHSGMVEHMGVRTMKLRDLSGVLHIVPYSEIGTIENLTKNFAFALFDVGVAYRENVADVIDIMKQVAAELRQDEVIGPKITDELEMMGLDRFGDSAVVIRARLRTRPFDRWAVVRAYNQRLKERFDAEGIEIPFPHRTLYFGVDKDGAAPPAPVALKSPQENKGKEPDAG